MPIKITFEAPIAFGWKPWTEGTLPLSPEDAERGVEPETVRIRDLVFIDPRTHIHVEVPLLEKDVKELVDGAKDEESPADRIDIRQTLPADIPPPPGGPTGAPS